MKNPIPLISALLIMNLPLIAQQSKQESQRMFIDVHQLEPGKVTFEDVAAAHQKDLAVQGKYNVSFDRFWVDESKGLVYCLSTAPDSGAVSKAHGEAHGLIPSNIYEVTDGEAAKISNAENLYLDIHYLGAGKVTAKDVEEAHLKDLSVQGKYNVNFINYWVDEKEGVVVCLSQANNSEDVVHTHEVAHGLIPDTVLKVKQGQ